jgi:hypothetical protein
MRILIKPMKCDRSGMNLKPNKPQPPSLPQPSIGFLLAKSAKPGWHLAYRITCDRVVEMMRLVETGAPALWSMVEEAIEACVAAGYLDT